LNKPERLRAFNFVRTIVADPPTTHKPSLCICIATCRYEDQKKEESQKNHPTIPGLNTTSPSFTINREIKHPFALTTLQSIFLSYTTISITTTTPNPYQPTTCTTIKDASSNTLSLLWVRFPQSRFAQRPLPEQHRLLPQIKGRLVLR
jgi:hypothetical protein